MFNLISKLFGGKKNSSNRSGKPGKALKAAPTAQRGMPVSSRLGASGAAVGTVPRPTAGAQPRRTTADVPQVEVAPLELKAIIDRFPADLKPLIARVPSPDVKVVLPVSSIMKQVQSGSVKISLASVRRQAPKGTFKEMMVEDKRFVEVPLSEIFKTLSPQALRRRDDQKRYDIPENAVGLFNGRSIANVEEYSETAKTFQRDVPSPAARKVPVIESEMPTQPNPAPVLRMPYAAPAAGMAIPKPAGKPSQVAAEAEKIGDVFGRQPHTAPNGTPVSEPGAGPTVQPSASPAPRKSPAANPAPTLAPAAPPLEGDLVFSLDALSASWPQAIKDELSALGDGVQVKLPLLDIGAGVTKGKVAFTWGQIRSGLITESLGGTSQDESLMLACPLKVVAPAFMAAKGGPRRPAAAAPVVDTSLPDFFGPTAGRTATPTAAVPPVEAMPTEQLIPQATPAPMPVPMPAEPTLKLAEAPAAVPAAAPAEPTSLSQFFGKVQLSWSPKEIVAEACSQPGMTGAVVALDEGFIIAHQLPERFSSEPFAAFLPQLMTRINKYTGEMQLGETHEVSIGTESGNIFVIQRGKLFFAALTESGKTIPTAGLRLAADELAKAQNN
jgi:predicted regulator of Ras-like GTPase activity (Roadblock/LC7/MglB family)